MNDYDYYLQTLTSVQPIQTNVHHMLLAATILVHTNVPVIQDTVGMDTHVQVNFLKSYMITCATYFSNITFH